MDWFEFLGRPAFDVQTYEALRFLGGIMLAALVIGYLLSRFRKGTR